MLTFLSPLSSLSVCLPPPSLPPLSSSHCVPLLLSPPPHPTHRAWRVSQLALLQYRLSMSGVASAPPTTGYGTLHTYQVPPYFSLCSLDVHVSL